MAAPNAGVSMYCQQTLPDGSPPRSAQTVQAALASVQSVSRHVRLVVCAFLLKLLLPIWQNKSQILLPAQQHV